MLITKTNRLGTVIALKLGFMDLDDMAQNLDIMCPVCMEVTNSKTSCNHTLCELCMRKVDICPLCRSRLQK